MVYGGKDLRFKALRLRARTRNAKDAALAGKDSELDRAEISLRAAQDRIKTLKAALADVEQQLVALERTKARYCRSQGARPDRRRGRT